MGKCSRRPRRPRRTWVGRRCRGCDNATADHAHNVWKSNRPSQKGLPMPSPFPGMDPYLEANDLWPWFQHQLAITLQQVLSSEVVDRYRIDAGERRFGVGPEERREEYVTVHAPEGERLVTLVDLVSPANKLTEAGRTAYLDTRKAARDVGASVVEIDLVLRGEPTLEYSRDRLPAWDYAVTVT